MLDPGRDVLLLDGDCGLCHWLARFMDPKLAPGVDIAYRPLDTDNAQNLIATFSKMAARVRYSIPVQGRSFLCQIGCSNTVLALHDMVLEGVFSGPLDNPITNM